MHWKGVYIDAVRRRKKGNITASFGNDLVSQGYTSIPNLVLKYYSKIGVTDSEMMLIIQLLRLKSFDNKPFPSLDQLAECMTGDSFKLKSDLAGLIEKKLYLSAIIMMKKRAT